MYARARHPVVPAGAARGAVPRRAAGARRARRDPRRPALPHDLVGRPGERRGDGPRGARPRLRVPGDLRPHAGGRRGPRAHAPTTSAARARRSPRPTRRWRRSACCAGSSATSSPTGGSTSPTTSSPSSTGSRPASTAASGCRGAEMTRRVEEALRNPYVRCLSHPTGRLINRRPENALDLERDLRGRAGARRRARGQRPARPPRPQRRARPRRAARRRADRLLDRRALGRGAAQHGARRRHRAPRLGRRGATCSTRGRWRRCSPGHAADGRPL